MAKKVSGDHIIHFDTVIYVGDERATVLSSEFRATVVPTIVLNILYIVKLSKRSLSPTSVVSEMPKKVSGNLRITR